MYLAQHVIVDGATLALVLEDIDTALVEPNVALKPPGTIYRLGRELPEYPRLSLVEAFGILGCRPSL